MSLLPWEEVRLKTDSNFEEEPRKNESGLEVQDRARKISYLSFIITEEEEDQSPGGQESEKAETEAAEGDEDEDDIFRRSLAPSALNLQLGSCSNNLGLSSNDLEMAFRGLNVRWGGD